MLLSNGVKEKRQRARRRCLLPVGAQSV